MIPRGPREMMVFFSWLYMGLGVCSFIAGVYLLYVNKVLGEPVTSGAGPIALLLIAFGPIRVAVSARVIAKYRVR